MTSGVLAASSASRSWFSATEPPTSAPERHGGAQAIDGPADGLGRRVGVGDRLHHGRAVGAGHGRHDLGDAGVGLGDRGDALRVALGGGDLDGARGALAEGLLDLGVADARAVRRSGRP